jgi:RNA polymerase sigma factor (sigma-70 family)
MPDAVLPPGLAQGRQQFLELVADIRPELHRYCARITGSVIDGEDVVQEVLAKAFYQLSMSVELPPLKPWLFRAAHNAAVDFCRRYDRANVDSLTEVPDDRVGSQDANPETVRAALSSFLVLPVRQRSAVILKDVLGLSLEEIAEAMESTVPAVKAALVRGRGQLRARAAAASEQPLEPGAFKEEMARLNRYAMLFNAKDWDGLRGVLTDEARLDLVSQASRTGKQVGQYFGRYAQETDLRLVPGLLEGRPALAMHAPAASPQPRSFILLEWRGDKVALIRDFKYVPYISHGAVFRPATP